MASAYGGPSHALALTKRILEDLGISVSIAALQEPSGGSLTVEADDRLFLFPKQFPKRYFYSEPLKIWLKDHVPEYDLLHLHSLFSFPTAIAGYYARRYKKPYLIEPNGTLDVYCMQRHYIRKRVYLEFFERKNINGARFIYCVSISEKKEIERFRFHTKCVVIPAGVLDEPKGIEEDARKKGAGLKTILFLSRIDPKKGLGLLFRAIKQLKAKRKDFRLVIAGSGSDSYVASIHKQTLQEGLSDSVSFLGEVTGEQKRAILHAADIFVLPSYRENFGLAVVEAMAAGCPVVISDQVAIHPEVDQYGAGKVVRLKSEDLLQALDELLSDQDVRIKMGENAQRLVKERFDVKENVKKLVTVYEGMLSGKRS